MAPMITLIRDLNMTKTQWVVKLRLIRLYEKPAYNDRNQIQSLECVFHDTEGDRIQGTVRRFQIDHFKKILKEGRVYAIRDFIVANQTDKYKATTTKHKIFFHGRTNVFEMFDSSFPRFMFNFKNFSELSNVDAIDETLLFDVIGRVVSMQSAQNKEFGGKITRFIELTIEDLENNRISCTLWEDYVDLILKHLETQNLEPIVIILQMCRAKVYRDQVKVTNSFHVTKMIVDSNFEEINEFKQRIPETSSQTRSISYITAPSTRTIVEDLQSENSSFRTLDELYTRGEVGSFWVCAKIVSFIGEWWYLSCNKYLKKLEEAGEQLYCAKCDSQHDSGMFRYKIQFQTVDETACASLLCWDRDCEALIGKPCSVLREECMEKQNIDEIPEEICSLLEKCFLFKVQIKSEQLRNYTGAFTVVKLTDDPALISKYGCSVFESQESDFYSKLQADDSAQLKDYSSGDEVNTPNKGLKKSSKGVENSGTKRTLLEEFSSSTTCKKLKSIIKKEDNKDD